ncbi:calcineurin-like phosphoesterase family protein [Labilibaculum sp. K2S]|uniref:calcineurin-like phosphoesterase family protein n=1 Tax=Labilibaculum sp. K2S TaxID=3056386 RepID=UPI0025A34701|nr:calcineurin-like phosphoesterase family protein [Labilibaculum sp. K2S]MDM8158681.1 calcineurin-like phosphoesterase family protein [Labilibaculum sp. K2S]
MIKRKIGILLFFLCLSLVSFSGSKSAETVVVKGKVSCLGIGVEGVAVTDGETVCLTNKNGLYSIPVNSTSRFVYISSPAGYSVPVVQSVPQFHHRISAGKKTCKIDFKLEKIKGDDTKHGFVAWADPQVKSKEEMSLLHEVVDDMSGLLKKYPNVPFHALGCGDITGDNHALYDTIKSIMTSTGVPFYQSIGNHDLNYNDRSNKLSESNYEDEFGPAYYSFNRGAIHYVVLNNVFYIGRDYFYIGYLPEKQLNWLEKDLSYIKEGQTIVVVMHIPSSLDDKDIKEFSYSNISKSLANKKALYKILAPYQTHIITGHMHVNSNLIIAPNIFEHNVSSVCGAWWQGPYAEDGTPKGYTVFEANGNDLKWYFKSFGKEKAYQFRMYPLGSNSEQVEYITANVWNWDPEWKVNWYEDGKLMGEMEGYYGADPETTKAYADKEKLEYKWIQARPTMHMFRAKPKSSLSEIWIEVIDRFGNVYKSEL